VLPTGIATDDTTRFFFQDVVKTKSLVSLFDFENKGIFFPGVHSSYKFCLFTTGRGLRPTAERAEFVFFAHAVEHLRDPERRFTLSAEDLALLNPNTRTCPIFRSRRDAELTKAIYRRVPVLIREARDGRPEENPWGIKFSTMFHMSNDSHLFRTREQLEADGWRLEGNIFRKAGAEYLPLYEAKMATLLDHRSSRVIRSESATIRQAQPEYLSLAEHEAADVFATPLYWVKQSDVRANTPEIWRRQWTSGWRRVSATTNERSFLQTIFPPAGFGDSIFLMYIGDSLSAAPAMLAGLATFVFDYVVRQKMGGLNLSFYVVAQLPVHVPSTFAQPCQWGGSPSCVRDWLLPRILELTYTAWDLEPFARDCGWSGPPFRWDEERRFLLRCELDAAFFHLYLPSTPDGQWRIARKVDGCPYDETPEQLAELKQHFPTPRDAVAYIMDTFPIVRRKDEEKYNGDYRTKRVILEIYDAMQESIRTGRPYQTRLDPPPADPLCCHPARSMGD